MLALAGARVVVVVDMIAESLSWSFMSGECLTANAKLGRVPGLATYLIYHALQEHIQRFGPWARASRKGSASRISPAIVALEGHVGYVGQSMRQVSVQLAGKSASGPLHW